MSIEGTPLPERSGAIRTRGEEVVDCGGCGATFRPLLTDGACPRCRRRPVVALSDSGPIGRVWSRVIARPEGMIAVLIVTAVIQLALFIIVLRS